MKYLLVLFCAFMPVFSVAQSLKIKNGTAQTFVEVQMNYEEHATGNLLADYRQNRPLKPNETFQLPHCSKFGAGDPFEMNISATDDQGNIYVYGEVEICKVPQIVFLESHKIELSAEEETAGEADETVVANEAVMEQFKGFVKAQFLPAIRSGNLTRLRTLFSSMVNDGISISIDGNSAFTAENIGLAKGWLGAYPEPPVLPNPQLQYDLPLAPTVFIGSNYGQEEEFGYYFLFDQGDKGWEIRAILDQDAYRIFAQMMTAETEADAAEQAEDSELIYFMTETAEPFKAAIQARNRMKLRKFCATPELSASMMEALDFLNENIARFSVERVDEAFEINGETMQVHLAVTIRTEMGEDEMSSGFTCYFAPDDNGGYHIVYVLAFG